MPDTSAAIFERFRARYDKTGEIALSVEYRNLLASFGNPQNKMSPVFHVAGTNGKGSTCAYLRSILEAAGYKTHVYISPHLITVHERFRVAGQIISESELSSILTEIENRAPFGKISYFEASTLAAFLAFARHPADFTILEVGLGGRLDATNTIDNPLATLITRLSFDHRDYLGDTIDKIAYEKAGIMRAGVPCFAMHQPDPLAAQTLRGEAQRINAPLLMENESFRIEERDHGFRFIQGSRTYDLLAPALLGHHQYHNAALAIAALSRLPQPLPQDIVATGLRTVEWPARLQRLSTGPLADLIPQGSELWLDGGHNDSAGEVLADQINRWRLADGANPRPLHIVMGMLESKRPDEFLKLFVSDIAQLRAVAIPGELSFTAEALADAARAAGAKNVQAMPDMPAALVESARGVPPRILICGSLYLAGQVLEMNLRDENASTRKSEKPDRAFTNLKLN